MVGLLMRRLVLASTSRYRRELFDRLGLGYEAVAPPFDEEAARLADPTLTPRAMAVGFSEGKVRSLAAAYPDALILGGDQVPALGETILVKPETRANARAQLRALSGRTHHLLTAVSALDTATGQLDTLLDVHEMTMWPLDDEEIDAYLTRDEPFDCAGSYRVEATGPVLFESMRGEDWTAIVGLPLTKVVALLRRHGVRVLRPSL
jgi:septum formation protein